VSKTDGVPLFVEELTKMVLESGLLSVGATGRSPLPLGIPTTLQDALMARLDRLGPAKEVAQMGATLGREFSYELLQAVAPVEEASLPQALAKLVEAEVLYQRGLPPQARYVFKHALIQDAAYQSLLKSTRQQYHQQIAHVLEQRFPETTETQPELLAYHYTEAGLSAQALPYWQRAGRQAMQRSAYSEAINHLTTALELLRSLPDTPERTQQELSLQFPLGESLMAVKGYAAAEVEQVYARARALCQQIGETPQLFTALLGLWAFYCVRGTLSTARELGEQLVHLAQSVERPARLAWAHYGLGVALFGLGELASARAHLEQSLVSYDSQQRRPEQIEGDDVGIMCRFYAMQVLWYLGYPGQALKRAHEALVLAQELAHPHILAWAIHIADWTHQFREEWQAAQEGTEALIALSREQGFTHFLALGTIGRGWALAEQGQGEEGIAQIRQGLAAHQAAGAEQHWSRLLAWLAEAYGKAGQTEEGFTVLTEALAVVDNTGERYYEAELYRLKGQLTLQKLSVASSQLSVVSCQ
jgi:predicted ATPase